MSQPQRHVPAPDAATIEAALVAACRHRGVDRSRAFDGGSGSRGVRILAGAALKARFGVAATVMAPLLKLAGPELAPSMLVRYGITTVGLLEVVEALGEFAGDPAPTTLVPELSTRAPTLHRSAPPPFKPLERKRPKASAPKAVGRLADTPSPRAHVVRLKPMTPAIARWAGFFLASPIWSADEVADLFGVHPDAVVDAVAGRVAA